MATDLWAEPVRIAACGCATPFGGTKATHRALLEGKRALQLTPVLGREGGDPVPLALLPGRALDETNPPAWLPVLHEMLGAAGDVPWGSARFPVCVASSNFGVGSIYALRREGDPQHAPHATPAGSVAMVRRRCGWGENIAVFSHACVSAHLAILEASRRVAAGIADAALVVAYDFLSPFVAGGFHALKILNSEWPAPYEARAVGSIGLGDGAAFAVLRRDHGEFSVTAQSLHNEFFHFTSNRPDGTGFAATLATMASAAKGRRVWLKGHGTGTLEAGKLEALAFAGAFPDAPLVGWKGSLGHTLGSCGLVELALAIEAMKTGRSPGTIGAARPTFTATVALETVDTSGCDGVVCASNAFGGAHGAFLVTHV